MGVCKINGKSQQAFHNGLDPYEHSKSHFQTSFPALFFGVKKQGRRL